VINQVKQKLRRNAISRCAAVQASGRHPPGNPVWMLEKLAAGDERGKILPLAKWDRGGER
jgi:hypothetical protein